MLKAHGAQLVYDVIKFDDKFRHVILYCVGTTVVCERSETAEQLAWNTDCRYRVAMPCNNSMFTVQITCKRRETSLFLLSLYMYQNSE